MVIILANGLKQKNKKFEEKKIEKKNYEVA